MQSIYAMHEKNKKSDMKGVSITTNTLVMLAVAIIVLLATVSWFVGGFGGAAEQSNIRQSFHNNCIRWAMNNCEGDADATTQQAYEDMSGKTYDKDDAAAACGCVEPWGRN